MIVRYLVFALLTQMTPIFLLLLFLSLIIEVQCGRGRTTRKYVRPPSPNSYAISQRPLMINQLNLQRSALKLPLLCQDSLLTSMAQQHANDMAALNQAGHDLPCDSNQIPSQFCLSASRMSGFGRATENIVSVARNGSSAMAMLQVNADSILYKNVMDKKYLYVGVGVAYNSKSKIYYWTQLFSTGDYTGVSCTLQPLVRTVNNLGKFAQYLQPQTGLNPSLMPAGISSSGTSSSSGSGTGKRGYFCTLIAFDPVSAANATMTHGSIPYPTIRIPDPNPPKKSVANQTANQQAIAQQALQAAMAYYSNTANATSFNVTAFNSTLNAVRAAVQQNSSLIAGLNGTDSSAYSQLYNEVTSLMQPTTTQ